MLEPFPQVPFGGASAFGQLRRGGRTAVCECPIQPESFAKVDGVKLQRSHGVAEQPLTQRLRSGQRRRADLQQYASRLPARVFPRTSPSPPVGRHTHPVKVDDASVVLEVEPPGATDCSEFGLLSRVARAGSQQRSRRPTLGAEVHVDPAHLAVAHFHKAQTGAVIRPGAAAPDAGSYLVGDGPGGRLGEDAGLGDPGLGTITECVDARKGVARVSGSTFTQPFSVSPASTNTSGTLCTGMPMNRS